MSVSLPKGFSLRPATMDDLQAVVQLVNTCSLQQTGQPRANIEELRTDWTWPEFNLAEDVQVVMAPDGGLVGYAYLRDNAPHVLTYVSVDVQPEYLGRGLGTALCQWAEARARRSIPKAPTGARVAIWQDPLSSDEPTQALLRSQGYRPVRRSYHMRIEMDALPPEPPVPSGITIRPFLRGREERAAVGVIRETFKGEWGWVERPFEEELEEYNHYFDSAPHADPELWFVALAGDELVGTCFGHPVLAEDPDTGYVFALGVLPPWRHKGIALALLRHTFRALYQKGKHKVRLGVDAENPTGATRLYEKAGMRVTREYVMFEKELRPGAAPGAAG